MAYSQERRNEIARSQGFRSYADKRAVLSYANNSRDFRRIVGDAGGRGGKNLDEAKLYYQAFKKGDPDDYTLHTRNGKPTVTRGGKGAKAKWLIDIAKYINDGDEWRRRYPNGARDDAWLRASMGG